ncbi:VOC family protein [Nocardia sp. NPDC060256]|uniref:VOC family protein n=1 Tax=unclassified Nocardia TaxID=2637762 RepID=UPI0036613422
MTLQFSPLSHVFLDTADLAAQRGIVEGQLGLRLLATEADPKARHGVVSYDAGTLIISYNLMSRRQEELPAVLDKLVITFSSPVQRSLPAGDTDGHRYLLVKGSAGRRPAVTELRLATADLRTSSAFYRDVLGLTLLSRNGHQARFDAGAITLVLQHRRDASADSRRGTYLLVFHTTDIKDCYVRLAGRGVAFKSRQIISQEFGRTMHFDDPTGHRFCLYEPSASFLTTAPGRKLMQISAGCEGMLPMGFP